MGCGVMDLLQELDEITREPYAGAAPLHFTADYFTPDELLAAHVEACRDGGGRHTWKLGITTGWCSKAPGHSLCLLTADLRCEPAHSDYGHAPCSCVGWYAEQANCPKCRWHFIGTEQSAVEAWHDHAWPGWRDLPVVPLALADRTGGMSDKTAFNKRGAAKARMWVEANYPLEWQVDHAPVVTERHARGTRHVPGYSPWGGFDLCVKVVGA